MALRGCMTLTSGICRGCKDNAGGIKKVYIADEALVDWTKFEQAPAPTADTDPVEGTITNLELVSGAQWYVFQVNKYSSNWTETINVADTGNVSFQQVVSLVFSKNAQDKRNVISEIAKGDLVMIIEDNNGKKWLIGSEDNGIALSGGSSTSGTAMGDMNGWSPEFTCNSVSPANEIAADATAGTADSEDVLLQDLLDLADEGCTPSI